MSSTSASASLPVPSTGVSPNCFNVLAKHIISPFGMFEHDVMSSSVVQGQDPASSRNQLQKGSISVERKFEIQPFYDTSGLSVYLLHVTHTINIYIAKRVATKKLIHIISEKLQHDIVLLVPSWSPFFIPLIAHSCSGNKSHFVFPSSARPITELGWGMPASYWSAGH